ncbi:MAG: PH domain-containing protein [Saprospiraceae bacterium]|nr:PH domain-containing protein [Candidatus Opimibacter iunctus]
MEPSSHLYQPQRQSPKAVLLILLKYLRIIVRQMWPILLIVLINPTNGKGIIITVIAFGIALISLIYSLVAYTRYYFFIENNELCVRSGVFRKTVLNVPFDRIQSIDFKRNLVHQFLNVVSVQVDTAGSKGSELELDAIELERAEELREFILAYKQARKTVATYSDTFLPPIPIVQETPELILALSPKDLMKIGISENHLRTAAIIFAFFLGLADDIDQLLGWDVYGQLENTTTAMSLFGLLATLVAIPLFIVISFTITLIRTVLKYYGLKFWREGKSYKVVSGLFTRNEKSIQKSKIQVIRWVTSPLKRLFGIYQMNIYQAANVDQNKDKSLVIPGCYKEQVDHTLDTIVPEFKHAVFTSHRMHPAIVRLMVVVFGFIPAVLFGLMAWYNEGMMQWLLTLVFPLAILMGYLYQRKRRLKIDPDFMISEGGIFGNSSKLIEIYKIQSVQIHSSPMQRRRGLTSLHVYTAGGEIAFPYLNEKIARQARDYILYRVEKEEKSWM